MTSLLHLAVNRCAAIQHDMRDVTGGQVDEEYAALSLEESRLTLEQSRLNLEA
jgi:hypothetical protein